jgi:hypothetical protein
LYCDMTGLWWGNERQTIKFNLAKANAANTTVATFDFH